MLLIRRPTVEAEVLEVVDPLDVDDVGRLVGSAPVVLGEVALQGDVVVLGRAAHEPALRHEDRARRAAVSGEGWEGIIRIEWVKVLSHAPSD